MTERPNGSTDIDGEHAPGKANAVLMSFPTRRRLLLRIGGQIPGVYIGADFHLDVAADQAPHFSACMSHGGWQARPPFQKRLVRGLLTAHATRVDVLMPGTRRNCRFFSSAIAWDINHRQGECRQYKQRRHRSPSPFNQPINATRRTPKSFLPTRDYSPLSRPSATCGLSQGMSKSPSRRAVHGAITSPLPAPAPAGACENFDGRFPDAVVAAELRRARRPAVQSHPRRFRARF